MTDTCRINRADIDSFGVGARRKASGRGGWRPGAGRKPELEDPVSVTFDMERPQIERLRAIAKERGVSAASLIRKAVDTHLRRLKGK